MGTPRNAVRLLPLLLLLVARAPVPSSSRDLFASTNITIGVLIPSMASSLSPPAMSQWRAAALLGAEDVNSNPAILPSHTLVPSFATTNLAPENALFATMDLLEGRGVAGLVGPTSAELSGNAALASSRARVNHLDVRSGDGRLADQEWYRFLHRMKADGSAGASAVLALCRHHGWTRVGVLVDSGTLTGEALVSLAAGAESFGVEIVRTVVMAVDPAVGPGDPLGNIAHVTDQVVKQGEARVWVHLVGPELSARVRIAMARAGACDAGFTWIVPDVGLWDTAEGNALEEAEGNEGLLTFYPGDLLLIPLAYSQDEAVVAPWRSRLEIRSAEGTALAPAEVNVDPYYTRWYHDAVVVIAHGLDAVQRLKTFCAEAAAPRDHTNCTEMLDDAGDDDETLRRAIRRGTVSGGYLLGFDISFDEATGSRSGRTVVVQAGGIDSIVSPAVIMPSGYVYEVPGTAWLWRGGSVAAPPDRPSFVRRVEGVSAVPQAVGLAAVSASLALCFACAAATLAYRGHRIIRMSSWRIEMVSLAGGAALLCQQAGLAAHLSDAMCTSRVWVDSIGFSLLFSPLFSKMYRIWCIFGGGRIIKVIKITDAKLAEVIGVLLLVDVAVLSAWQAAASPRLSESPGVPVATSDALVFVVPVVQLCGSDGDSLPFTLVDLVIKIALLATGSWLAFATRKVAVRALNDAKYIGLSIYTTALLTVMLVPMFVSTDQHHRDSRFMMEAIAAFLIVTSTVALVFVPKLWAIHTGTEDGWTSTDTASGASGAAARATKTRKTGAPKPRGGTPGTSHLSEGIPRRKLSLSAAAGPPTLHPHSPLGKAAALQPVPSTQPTTAIPRRLQQDQGARAVQLSPLNAAGGGAPTSSQPSSPTLVASPPASPPPAGLAASLRRTAEV